VIKISPNYTIFDNSTDYAGFRIKRLGAKELVDGYRTWLGIPGSIILRIEQELLNLVTLNLQTDFQMARATLIVY